MVVSDIMIQKVFKRCELLLEDNLISCELITKVFSSYLATTINNEDHNIGIVLHTGSVIYDAIILAFVAVSNLIFNNVSSEDTVFSLDKGDYVVYGKKKKKRWIFESIVTNDFCGRVQEFALLKTKTENEKVYVRRKMWRFISPYRGTSKITDGRGIKIKNTTYELFFKYVLDYKDEDIPSVTDTTSVIIMTRERADYILKNLVFSFQDHKLPLLELVTASYYTENDEKYYFELADSGKSGSDYRAASADTQRRK